MEQIASATRRDGSYVIYEPYWDRRKCVQHGDFIYMETRDCSGSTEKCALVVEIDDGKYKLHCACSAPLRREPMEFDSQDQFASDIIGMVVGIYRDRIVENSNLFRK